MEVEESSSSTYDSGMSHFVNLQAQNDVQQQIQNRLTITGTDQFEEINWTNLKGEIPDDIQISQVKFADLKIENPPNELYEPTEDVTEEGFADIRKTNVVIGEETLEESVCVIKQVNSLYKCTVCSKSFTSKVNIRAHSLKKHRVKSLFTCELCSIKLDSTDELLKHINCEHKSLDDRYYCGKCDFSTVNYGDISSHTHEIHTCDDCGKSFKSLDKLESHKLTHTGNHDKKQEKNFICDTCGRRFAFGCLLRDHINLHTGAKPYLCPVCGRSFTQKASLKQHARTHNSVRPHKCTDCDQAFFSKGDLKKHLRKHTGERPYICELCGEGFSQNSHLGYHKKTHTGERPYPCDICGRGFTKKGDVARHRRIHTGELPYLCQVCGKAFRQSTQCSNHIKNHHPNSSVTVVPNPTPIPQTTNYQHHS